MAETKAPGKVKVATAPETDPISALVGRRSADPEKVASPEGLPFNVTPAPGPDVGLAEVTGAGFTAEKIETDRWFLTHRTEDEYRWAAYEAARAAGVRLPDAPDTDVPFAEWREMSRSERRAAGLPVSEIGGQWKYRGRNRNDAPDAGDFVAGGLPGTGYQREPNLAHRRLEALLAAREANPEIFEGIPITPEEIRAAVNAEQKAEWEDAQETLGLAGGSIRRRYIPEFLGRMGAAATDEINAPLAVATLGVSTQASLGRIVLTEAGIAVLGEGLTIPKQIRRANELDLGDVHVAKQLAFAAVLGGAFPVALRGAEVTGRQVINLTNQQVVERLRGRASGLNAEERAAVSALEAETAAETVTPSPGRESVAHLDDAVVRMEAGEGPDMDVPPIDPDAAEALVTPPAIDAPLNAEWDNPVPPSSFWSDRDDGNVFSMLMFDLQKDFGLTEAQAAGVVGSLAHESAGFQTLQELAPVVPGSRGGFGYAQWTGPRRRAFEEYVAANGLDPNSYEANYGFLAHELKNTPEGKVLRGLRNAASADDATQVFTAQFLRPGIVHLDSRIRWARGVAAGNVEPVAPGAGGPVVPQQYTLAASGVLSDPKTYQFRSGVDASGVTVPLDRATGWDEILAGDFIVHERSDGLRYVADGHHRLQLAQRLEAEGADPINLRAFVFREEDGFSVEQVRAIAAMKNIEAGSATAVDAAKLLRVSPEVLERLTLRNSQARDARGLMRLDDESFDMVVNGIVPEPYAAMVGELTEDAAMQGALMRTLAQVRPKSQLEARQVVQDAYRAGFEAEAAGAQGSLFGDEFDVMETLFKERAEVFARAMAQLKSNKKLFKTLVGERDRIKGAGNRLADDANRQRLQTDEEAITLVQKLVNKAGPVDEALNAAARQVRGGVSATEAARGFVSTIRGELEGGGANRFMDGGARGAGDAVAPDASADAPGLGSAEVGLGEAFSDPSPEAPAVAAQVSSAENAVREALEAGENFEFPTGLTRKEGDSLVPEMMSAREVIEDLDADADFLKALEVCKV